MVFRHFLSRHICSTVAETIGVTNYTASFGAKNVQKTSFEAAEIRARFLELSMKTRFHKNRGTSQPVTSHISCYEHVCCLTKKKSLRPYTYRRYILETQWMQVAAFLLLFFIPSQPSCLLGGGGGGGGFSLHYQPN